MSDRELPRAPIEWWIGIGAVAALAVACALILLPFISAGLWAAILCFTTWPLFAQLNVKLGGRRTLAATIATLILSGIIIAPVAILASKLSSNLTEIIAATHELVKSGPPGPPSWVASIPLVGPSLADRWNVLSESNAQWLSAIAAVLPSLKDALLGSGRAVGAGVFQIVLSVVLVFIFYRNGESTAKRLQATVDRIGGERGGHLLEVAGITIRAVVYGVLGAALVQGILAGGAIMIAGVPGAVLLGFAIFVVAMIPGGPLVVGTIPVLWLYYHGFVTWAIFIAVWMMIVGNLDNFVRPYLINRGGSQTPLILIVFGILGGAMTFGIIGLFLGPTLLAIGYTMFDEWSSVSPLLSPDADKKIENR
ncbi:MAG TPA: AI-2E family transporter [Candidatus Binataceae bacterium]|nr:AI-2E family transporter [Candidatus Binataceae bacterium]